MVERWVKRCWLTGELLWKVRVVEEAALLGSCLRADVRAKGRRRTKDAMVLADVCTQ